MWYLHWAFLDPYEASYFFDCPSQLIWTLHVGAAGGRGSGSEAGNRLQKADYLRGHPRSAEIPRAVGYKTGEPVLWLQCSEVLAALTLSF